MFLIAQMSAFLRRFSLAPKRMVVSAVLILLSGVEAFGVQPTYHSGRIIIMPKSGNPALAVLQTSRGHQVLKTYAGFGGLQVLQIGKGESVESALERYRASGWVQFAEPDFVVSIASTFPNDPFFQNGTQWALNNYGQNGGLPDADLDAPEAWDVSPLRTQRDGCCD